MIVTQGSDKICFSTVLLSLLQWNESYNRKEDDHHCEWEELKRRKVKSKTYQ